MMKLGLVGCGAVASKFHIPAINAIPEIRLEAVTDTDLQHAKKFANRNKVKNVFSSHEKMLDYCSLDSVLVCTPPSTHARIVLDVIDRGKHVICEKPFTLGPEEAEEIAQQNNGTIVFPAHNYVFTPALNTAREWSLGRNLGALRSVNARIGVGFWSWRSRTEYRTDEQSGVISDLLYHVVYVVNSLARIDEVLDVTAERRRGVARTVRAKVRLEKNIEATISADWTSLVPKFELLMNYANGSIRLDLMKRPFWISGRESGRTIRTTPLVGRMGEIRLLMMGKHPSFVLEHTNFLRSVESKESQQVTVQDAIETLSALQSIREMIREK